MANEISNVEVFTEHKLPHSHAIKLVAVIKEGSGSFTEVLDGGNAIINLVLDRGSEVKGQALKVGETVFIWATKDGEKIRFPNSFTVGSIHKPWNFRSP